MPTPFPQDDSLRRLMAQAQIPSYRALSQRAGVPPSSIRQLRRGQIGRMRLETLQRLGQALGVEMGDLVAGWKADTVSTSAPDVGETPEAGNLSVAPEAAAGEAIKGDAVTVERLYQEYARLQERLTTQAQDIQRQVQRQALGVIEPWLRMGPNVIQAAQQQPDFPARKLIPLTRPLQELLETWAVRPIGTLGEVVPYDPKIHQIHSPTGALVHPGQAVKVRHLGYWHGEDLIYRATVAPIDLADS